MQANFKEVLLSDKIKYAVGNAETTIDMENVKSLPPFADSAIDFFNDLSKLLLKTGKKYSDVATFAFWCRKASLESYKAKYDDLNVRLGKGIVFHSTPSNVPVNFAFSFAAGLLSGNANIVRLPAKDFEQVTVICNAIKEILRENHANMAPYISMIKYAPSKELSDCFSLICDTRVVWGGDNTVAEMRRSPLKPRANEITFADRHSIAVIDVNAYDKATDKKAIANAFYNDTYFSDQNACTSPRLVVWYAKNSNLTKVQEVKNEFWKILHGLVREKYTLTPVQAVGKLNALYKVAGKYDVKKDNDFRDNFITRVKINSIDERLMKFKYNSGFFFEYETDVLESIMPCCGEPCQTLSYYGLDPNELCAEMIRLAPHGVDRIVPIGKTMDFDLIWDGHDLIREMSRRIYCFR